MVIKILVNTFRKGQKYLFNRIKERGKQVLRNYGNENILFKLLICHLRLGRGGEKNFTFFKILVMVFLVNIYVKIFSFCIMCFSFVFHVS